MKKISENYNHVHIREWNKPLEKDYCCLESKTPKKYIANVTWEAIDFAACGDTEQEARKNIIDFINN